METDAVDRLLSILDLERIDENLYRGTGAGGETPNRIFGGQVISQALRAAYYTVPDHSCHSLHAYFMRPGDPSHPVVYHVDRSRDGRSFTTRRVIAKQNGEQILVLAASFQKQEAGHDHQHPMPTALPDPDTLPSRGQMLEHYWDKMSPQLRRVFGRPSPVELREVSPRDPLNPKVEDDHNSIWFRLARSAENLGLPLNHCLLAYASDLYLLPSSLRPMGESMWTGHVMTASLDHAMWFHRPLNFNDWHLYDIDTPSTSNARGFNRGSIFDQSGRLVASTAQEGLVRPMTS